MAKKVKKKEKQVVKTQTLTWELITYDDGTSTFNRTNDGFYTYELLGLIEQVKLEVVDQLMQRMKPTKVKRRVIKD